DHRGHLPDGRYRVVPRGGDGGVVPTTRSTRSREKPEQIADELRALIVSGQLAEGESLGREPDLVERFGVSRPSLREALRILEAEGLITVVRGVLGGVVAHQPDARNVTLGDVHQARSMIEPAAVRVLATSPSKKAVDELTSLVEAQRAVIDDPEEFGKANARFHERLIELSGNQTIGIVAEMLNEIIARAVTAVSQTPSKRNSLSTRRRGIRSQERLLELIAIGASNDAEAHWRTHMDAVGKVMIGHMAKTAVDLLNHY